MTHVRKFASYVVVLAYAIYNLLWLAGTMFAYGRNDTRHEIVFLCTTFVLDIPILAYSQKNQQIGLPLFGIVICASLLAAQIQDVLNGATLVLWYLPKAAPFATAFWQAYSSRRFPV